MKPVVQQVSLCSGALNRAREAKGVQSWAVGETAPERKRKQIGSLMNSGGGADAMSEPRLHNAEHPDVLFYLLLHPGSRRVDKSREET